MHPTGLVDFAVFFSVSKALHLAARRGQAEVKKCTFFLLGCFFPSTAVCMQFVSAGCAVADRRRFDHKPAQIYWFGQCTLQNGIVYGCLSSGVSCLDVALRSESQKCLFLGAGAPLGLADKDSNMLMQS